MYSRRRTLAAIASGAAVSVAGCALFDDEIEKSASPARVSESAREGTGFEKERMEDQRVERTVSVSDEERDLVLTNWRTEYTKLPGEKASAASLLIFTTPTVSVAGREANPFDRLDEREFIGRLTDRSRDGDLDQQDGIEVEILGSAVELSIYETVHSVAGQTVDIRQYFGTLTNDGDLLAVLGTHPVRLDESENVRQLATGIEHPVDPPEVTG